MSAQVCSLPSAIASTPDSAPTPPGPTTLLGVMWGLVLPLPTSPRMLRPQHFTPLLLVSAQE